MRQSPRDKARPERKAQHRAETGRRRRSDEIQSGNRRLERCREDRRSFNDRKLPLQRWAQKIEPGDICAKPRPGDYVIEAEDFRAAVCPAQRERDGALLHRRPLEVSLKQERDAPDNLLFMTPLAEGPR